MEKTKKRIVFALVVVFVFGYFVFPDSAFAQAIDVSSSGNSWYDDVIKSLLYAFVWLSSLIASAGMTLLYWAMTPEFFSGPEGVMNRVSIYESWRFIRDFFNIFFIFALLFSAFATIFQVEQYSIKKMLLSLVLWALLVNFSFPIARFMVDLSNVPMYYFANQLFNPGSTGNMGSILSATKLENLIMTGKADQPYEIEEMEYNKIFAAIIFLFILGVTLMVLGVMFVIRTVALITLVIFSAVGFSGLAIPWFKKYAGMWWDNMFKYLIYGPAATLLILIAVRFFAEIGNKNDPTFDKIRQAAGSTTTGDMQTMIGSMAMYTIPIAMLWMSIGLAGSFSIFGAAAVSGKAKVWAKQLPIWSARKLQAGAAWGKNKALYKRDEDGNAQARAPFAKFGFMNRSAVRSLAKQQAKSAATDSDDLKSYKGLVGQMSGKDLEKEFGGSFMGLNGGKKKILAAQSLVKSGQHKKLDTKTLNELERTLRSANDQDNLKKLRDDRPDTGMFDDGGKALSGVDVKAKIAKLISSGDHKKLNAEALFADGNNFLDEMIKAGPEEAIQFVKDLPEAMQARVEEKVRGRLGAMGADANDWSKSEGLRKVGAAVSKNSNHYFADLDTTTGKLGTKIGGSFSAEAGQFYQAQKAKDFEQYSAAALGDIFEKTGTARMAAVVGNAKLDADQMSEVKNGARARVVITGDAKLSDEMNMSPKWKNV